MSITSAAGLVETLRKQHILGPDRLDEAENLQRRFPDARALAGELTFRGWITGYQANELIQGHGDELVLGAYLLLERLGQGGMGQVFKAHHQFMNRIVALKIIRAEFLANPEIIRRFHQEVRAVAQLNHPNIVTAYDAACLGDLHFLVMEYVEGIDLARLLKQRGPLPIAQACDFARQVALGLQHALEKGLVHRDIKPGNLMVTPQGVVKILDLGLARLRADQDSEAMTALTKEGAVLGTSDYMAPEQALDSKHVDIRADLYSLGCALYHFLTGQAPFPRGSLVGKALAHQQETPVGVQVLRPDLPPGLVEVLSRLLAKKPADRYQVPDQLAQVLLPFAQPALAPPELFPERDSTSSVDQGGPSPSSSLSLNDQDAIPTVTEAPSFTQVLPSPNRPQRRPGWRRGVAVLGVLGCGLALTAAILILRNTSDEDKPTPPAERPGNNQKPPPGGDPVVVKPPTPAPDFTNSVGMKLMLIPKGKFLMGSPASELKRQIIESQHEVSLTRPYYLGAYEVTQEQFQAVMGKSPSHFSRQGAGKLYVQMIAEADLKRFPVENVTWEEAVTFCQKLSALPEEKRLGRAYRLPTEAEWEYACRAGVPASPFHFGSQLSSTEANFFGSEPYGGAAKGLYLSRTAAVGSYKPNAWGLYDMHGNVWEWCSDWLDNGNPGPDPKEDPHGPNAGTVRCVRGGSWGNAGWDCRSASRGGFDPNKGYPHVGFRVACTATPQR
jgi:serine/threonine-protein kinase